MALTYGNVGGLAKQLLVCVAFLHGSGVEVAGRGDDVLVLVEIGWIISYKS